MPYQTDIMLGNSDFPACIGASSQVQILSGRIKTVSVIRVV